MRKLPGRATVNTNPARIRRSKMVNANNSRQSPHFFSREPDGSVRLRIRFLADEADLIEEAAGAVPLMTWIHQTVIDTARAESERQHAARQQKFAPPEDA